MKDSGFIKLKRVIKNWQWYTDIKVFKLYIHLILCANWEEGEFLGIHVERGQTVRSIPMLAEESGLTEKEVRRALNCLKKTGEITQTLHGKIRVITLTDYETFGQDVGRMWAGCGQDVGRMRAGKGQHNNNNNNKDSNFNADEFFEIAVAHAKLKAEKDLPYSDS